MPDPALLALMQHFASPPPAIVQPSEIVDAEPFLSALEAAADDQDGELSRWLRRSELVCERMRSSVAANPGGFALDMFDDLISRLERFSEWEAKNAAKRDRLWRRRPASDRLRALQDRMAIRGRRRLEAVDDLVLFLRAMRAEADPGSRGGPTFEDPDALARHILSAIA